MIRSIIVFLLIPSLLLAEDFPKPKEIYQEGYVSDLGLVEKPPAFPTPTPKKPVENDPVMDNEQPSATVNAESTPEAPSDPLSNAKSYKVNWVGAILNMRDHKHYSEKISELYEVAVKYDLDIGDIYSIGTLADQPQNDDRLSKLILRGGKLFYGASFPPQYPAKTSPALLIATPDEVILLESKKSLLRFFNSSGSFVPGN